METFTEFKTMVADPRYPDRRKKCLDKLKLDELDAPVAGLVKDMCQFPFCFTIQSCYGHFLYAGQEDPKNVEPLKAADKIQTVEYRIAYVALCVENSRSGNVYLRLLKQVPEIDPFCIQFGCAEWFWGKYPNSYVLQVEPEKHKREDRCAIDYQEALHVEKVRIQFYDHLKMLISKISRT
ncbi:MAG: hypothetical protein V2J65_10655 [Desulfobacteraceae bacterium]|jgi:hypothetical protein|nr:hypothetical protein [Desulfobacteraceae bacterium]